MPANRYVYGNGLIYEYTDDAVLYHHYNNLGSTTKLTDATGAVVETYTYGVYGELLGGDTSLTRFMYNGRCGVSTDDNGLYYMRQRYYNPTIKRFVNQDILTGSIGNSQSLNRYSYVQGNPVSYTDPFGLSPLNGLFSGTMLAHAVCELVGWIPGPVGSIANFIDGIVYAVVDKDYKNALYSLGSSVSFGAGKLVAWAGKGSKTALRIQRACNFIGSGINFAQSAEGTYQMGGMMIDKYIVQGQPFSGSTVMELFCLGANAFGATKSGTAVAGDLKSFAKGLKRSKAAKANLQSDGEPSFKMNLQFFAGDGTYQSGSSSGLKINQLPLAKPGEDLYVGTYSKSSYWNKKTGLNITHTPHHVVQDAVSSVSHGKGITINIRKDIHINTETYGSLRTVPTNRQHLAADIAELRVLLKEQGYSRSTINAQLNELIKQNKALGGFDK